MMVLIQATAFSPAGQTITATNQLLFTVYVLDVVDGLIDADSIVWTSDKQSGLLGNGGESWCLICTKSLLGLPTVMP